MPLPDKIQRYYFGSTIPTELQDFDVNGNLIYEGYSMPGVPETTAGFVIIKHVYQVNSTTGLEQDIYDSFLPGVVWILRSTYAYP